VGFTISRLLPLLLDPSSSQAWQHVHHCGLWKKQRALCFWCRRYHYKSDLGLCQKFICLSPSKEGYIITPEAQESSFGFPNHFQADSDKPFITKITQLWTNGQGIQQTLSSIHR
jgi:hypothetical protein